MATLKKLVFEATGKVSVLLETLQKLEADYRTPLLMSIL